MERTSCGADKLESAPQDVRSKGYDLVLNGVELGSGSIRIHSQELQSRVFALLGLDERQRRERFGFFLDALSYGTPPHGGIALGLDRVVALLAGEKSLREVIAFPKTTTAQDLMAEAPSDVEAPSLEELELMSAFPKLSSANWELATIVDGLLSAIRNNVFSQTSLLFDNKLRAFCNLTLASAWKTGRSVVRLAKSGYGQPAAILSRSLFESWTNLSWLSTDPENRLQGLEKSPRGPTLKEKATDSGLSAWYEALYPHLSELTHPNLDGLASYAAGGRVPKVEFGPSNTEVQLALATAFISIYMVLQLYLQQFPGVEASTADVAAGRFQKYVDESRLSYPPLGRS